MPPYKKGDIVPFRADDPEVCPYCGIRPNGIYPDMYSDDHIFMEAMGGKKTIRVCKTCNDRCGGKFEAQQLKNMAIKVSILAAKAGVPIAEKALRWQRAVQDKDGNFYDLVFDENGVRTEYTKPLVVKDPNDPKLLHVTVDGAPEAQRRLLKGFSDPKRFRLEGQSPGKPGRTQESSFDLNLDKVVGLTALKMVYATAVAAFPDEVERFKDGRADLTDITEGFRVRSVIFDHRDHKQLDAMRPPLAHTIYAEEQNGMIHGVVQFFGAFQAYVKLCDDASRSYETGVLRTLDPTTGVESDPQAVPKLEIRPWTGDEVADRLSPIKKFNADARRRGASADPLDVSSVKGDDGISHRAKSSIPGVSWTGDIPGRKR